MTADQAQYAAWKAWQAAEEHAQKVCSDPAASHAQRWSASWQAKCAMDQWEDRASEC